MNTTIKTGRIVAIKRAAGRLAEDVTRICDAVVALDPGKHNWLAPGNPC
ncbi:hypothetical protein GGQ71_002336 [Rhizobium taibaishanense]|uniref:Uncharacterized protein n=1 Tax=Allorhizobium taibaishanense TaxID=887144 RepID=A0A7W6HND6_9HYPH|nr:hypothetical protein [Allorhizobium taibaishanense]